MSPVTYERRRQKQMHRLAKRHASVAGKAPGVADVPAGHVLMSRETMRHLSIDDGVLAAMRSPLLAEGHAVTIDGGQYRRALAVSAAGVLLLAHETRKHEARLAQRRNRHGCLRRRTW